MNKKDQVVIEVRKSDITKGVCEDPAFCPIAHAIRRRFKHYKKAVSVSWIVTVGDTEYTLPTRATNFIDAFDSGREVKPFRFTLERV